MTSPEFGKGEIEIAFNALRKVREQQGTYVLKDVRREYAITKEAAYQIIDQRLNDAEAFEESLRRTVDALGIGQVSINPLTVTATNCLFMAMEMMKLGASRFRTDRTRERMGIIYFDMGRGFGSEMLWLLGEESMLQNQSTNQQADNELLTGPTGFLFLDKLVKGWNIVPPRRGGMIELYEVKEAVIDGVKFGAETYKRVYPITERVLSSSS